MQQTTTRIRLRLGVLSAVGVLLAGAPASAQTLHDHLKCVSVNDSLTVKARVDLEARRAEFGVESGCRVSKTALLCTPVAKTVTESNLPPIPGSSGDPLTNDMLCYRARCPGPTPSIPGTRGDQFGMHQLRARETRLLCVPAGSNCTPSAEICDGLDNDCDGAVDDLPPLSCGVGACANTVAACLNGAPQTCTPGTPAPETCNGIDDNCDGSTDEGIPDLTCGVGECQVTVPACVNGTPQTCTPRRPAPAEICDGRDNDCDGQSDEGLTDPVACGVGECRKVIASGCVNGQLQVCEPHPAQPELCDDLKDNNCNLLTDESGCVCPQQGTVNCSHAGDGCEVDPQSDHDHCGGCGRACSDTQVCTDGACVAAP